MRNRRRESLGILYVTGLASMMLGGCVSAPAGQQGAFLDRDMAATRAEVGRLNVQRSVLTSAELALTNERWTDDAVRRLRPEFLRGSARGPLTGPPEIALYVGESRMGDVSLLRMIPLTEIREIAFMHPTEARLRFGLTCGCANGAVAVTIRRASDR